MKGHSNRRRNYFVDKAFQTKFIVKFCLILMVASFLIGGLTYLLNLKTTTVAFDSMRVVVKSTSDFIMPITLYILVIVTLLSSVMTIVLTLFISHRISGPLYKFSLELKTMQGGDLSSVVRIRSEDQFKQTANNLDCVRQKYQETFKEIKDDLNCLYPLIANDGSEEILNILNNIKNRVDGIKTE